MLEAIIAPLATFATYLIETFGYFGIGLAMAIESACIPLPSEIIMPFSGYMVSQGHFTLIGVAIAGTIGCVAGSMLAYALGYYGGEEFIRSLIRKYGKYLFIKEKELDHAIHWFDKYGNTITFSSRLLPIIRTFISLPAGISKMPFLPFIFFAAAGSFIWSLGLAYIGLILGENWHTIGGYFHKFDIAIIVIALLAILIFFYKRYQKHTNSLIYRIRKFFKK